MALRMLTVHKRVHKLPIHSPPIDYPQIRRAVICYYMLTILTKEVSFGNPQ
jgi:hypothetical protein